MANRFYFAYGSNMNPDRIRERIPQARLVGTASILGWRLKERLYADIERCAFGRVCGVLYLLTQTEILHLDAYEGYPRTYGCVELDAMLGPEHKVPAFTYVMTEAARREREKAEKAESRRDRLRDVYRRHVGKGGKAVDFGEVRNLVEGIAEATYAVWRGLAELDHIAFAEAATREEFDDLEFFVNRGLCELNGVKNVVTLARRLA